LIPKDIGNLPIGQPTYGIFEYIYYLDTLFLDIWLQCSEPSGLGLGLGVGLIVCSFITKSVFTPLLIYSQSFGVKMKLLQPDQDELTASFKRLSQQGNREGAKIERAKIK
jgi:membrane protein insertase Oxa1/YidC/SpoIIIJ